MSLAERLSSMEAFEPNGQPYSANGKDRRLSFNPVGEWMPPAEHEVPIAAFEVSKTKRIREFCCRCLTRVMTDQLVLQSKSHLQCSTVSSLQALSLDMLPSSRSSLTKASIEVSVHRPSWTTTSRSALSKSYGECCPPIAFCAHTISLNFMFTVAAVATNVSALPIGAILDKYGPRVLWDHGQCIHCKRLSVSRVCQPGSI